VFGAVGETLELFIVLGVVLASLAIMIAFGRWWEH